MAHWAADHRRSILFLVALLALGGAASALKLPVSLFPQVDFPRVRLVLEAGDRPADQMALAVTRPIELAVRSVPGVKDIRSTTSRGSAELVITFDWGHDMTQALLQIEAAANQALSSLPPGTTFQAHRMEPTVLYGVVAYSLTSKSLSLVQLHDIAQYQLVPVLSALGGVARIGVEGGQQAEFHVDVDPAQLQALDLSLEDVVKAVSAANVLQSVGRMQDHYKLLLMLSDTRFHNIDDIRHTIVRSGENGLVELDDIASVTEATVPQWITVTANGQDAVLVSIYQQRGGNTVQIIKDVDQKLNDYRKQLPAGVEIKKWYDQGTLVTASASSVRDAIIFGVVLAALVLLVFLRSWRITLIAILVVPATLATTILLLYVLNMSFNIMTLGGMAAAVGLIVDDAIVMVEHIVRRFREGGAGQYDLVRGAAREFTYPLSGSSAATIIIFLPLAFLSGVTGAFFKALSLTMASALVISYFIAWVAVPLLADHLLKQGRDDKRKEGRLTKAVNNGYRRLMARLLRQPWWLLIGVVPLVVAGWFGYKQVGTGFMPSMDEGGFVLDYRAPPGTSLEETDRLLRQVGGIIRSLPSVATYSRRTGTQLGGGLTEANTGDFFINLKPEPRKPVTEVMDTLRQRVEAQVPGLQIETSQLMEDIIGDLTAVAQPIEIKLYSDSEKELLAVAPKVAKLIRGVNGVVEVKDGIVVAGDALTIQVDRAKAALEGIDPEAVTRQLDTYFSGTVTTQVQEDVKMVGVRVWVPRALRSRIPDVGDMRLRAADGHLVPVRRIAQISVVTGQPEITRENLKRMVAVTGRISGRDMGSTVADVKQALKRANVIPQGMYYVFGGLYKQQQIAFRGLMEVIVAAVALVFVLLLFLYERFLVAITLLIMPLLAMLAVFIGLWVTGIELNITAMMGMTMVVGIVTEISVFYFSEYKALTDNDTNRHQALTEAGVNRMRPIAMTSLAAALALSPLAIGWGQGSSMQQPLAIAIISGLLVQMPLVLVLMPVLYAKVARVRP